MNIQFKNEKPPADFDPKSDLAVKTLNEKLIGKKDGLSEDDLINTKEKLETLKNTILGLKRHFPPGFDVDIVISKLIKEGIIKQPPKVEPVVSEPVVFETEYQKPEITKIETNEYQKSIIEANLLLKEIENTNVFRNDEELDSIHEKVLNLQKERIQETPEYYYEFSKAGLIKGGEVEVKRDLDLLEERKQDFKKKEALEDPSLIKAKKIATITEKGLSYIVSELSMYGDKVSIENTPEFTDVKLGVDDVLQIKQENNENRFLGLGIDVTFRALSSDQFKDKFFKLLGSIKNGHKTKIKYFKNHEGEMMEEFNVPKMVLSFNVDNVKEIVNIIKNKDNPNIKEDLKRSPMKILIMQQVISSCNLLAKFAKEHNNDISEKYIEVINSLQSMSPADKGFTDLNTMEDKVSRRKAELILEYKDTARSAQTAA